MLKFDEETTRLLETVYQGADITRRRQASFDILRPAAGEVFLDIGCGNGLLTLELARAVGSTGKVIGIDPSIDMLEPARRRCAEFEWVEIIQGSAGELPFEANSVDKAVSVQVFEYLDNIPKALAELYRILKPGGKLAIGDIHFDSLIWASDDRKRMDRMIAAWDHHFAERRVPEILPPMLKAAGFVLDEIRPLTICDHTLKPDGLAIMMMMLMRRFAVDNGHISAKEGDSWFAEQEQRAAQGRFFFSLTHFVVSAVKPHNTSET